MTCSCYRFYSQLTLHITLINGLPLLSKCKPGTITCWSPCAICPWTILYSVLCVEEDSTIHYCVILGAHFGEIMVRNSYNYSIIWMLALFIITVIISISTIIAWTNKTRATIL